MVTTSALTKNLEMVWIEVENPEGVKKLYPTSTTYWAVYLLTIDCDRLTLRENCIHIFDAPTVWIYKSPEQSFYSLCILDEIFQNHVSWDHGWRFCCKESWKDCLCFSPGLHLYLTWHYGLLKEPRKKRRRHIGTVSQQIQRRFTDWNIFRYNGW